MLTHPELLWDLAKQHQRELISEAEQQRLLATARRHRHWRTSPAARVTTGESVGAASTEDVGPRR
jgi:hypothetical protein